MLDSLPTNPRCRIVGVLDDGIASLSANALLHIQKAQMIIGARRTLDLFQDQMSPQTLQRPLSGALSQVPEWIRAAQSDGLRVVVLATGDPLCFGIAAYLAAHLCIDAIEVIPNVSTLQLACARLGMPWQQMKFSSVHAKDAGEWLPGSDARHGLYSLMQDIRQHARLAILTGPENSPDKIARMLVIEGMQDDVEMAVCERLCQDEERIITGICVSTAAEMRFAEPNVMLLWRTSLHSEPVLFGHADDAFQQRYPEKGLITKQEVRAVSLARLQLRADSIVWDIGAGSGSVGLEAARLCRRGHVYAIEKNLEDSQIALSNLRRFGLSNYTLENAKAPAGLDLWPAPDAIFIGGSGGELDLLIELCLKRLKPHGKLVMNFVTLENLATAVAALKQADASWDVITLQASRSKPILHMHRMAAENPVWLVCAESRVLA